MRIRKKTVIAAAAAAVIAGLSGTYGYFSDVISVTNRISTGDVDISLAEYELLNGQEVLYVNPKTVLPGETVSKIPRITNHAHPCWIRTEITCESDQAELQGLSSDDILGISEKWVKKGDYYYYKDVLDRGETVTFFTALEIPRQWTEIHELQNLRISIRADAIQAANFQPDFTAMSPWGNQEIELCIHEENGEVISKTEKTELSVVFCGSAHKLIAVPDDFFVNMGTAMPGDVFQDSAEISNTTGNPAEIFFHTGIVCQREDRMDLLKKLRLTIAMNGNTLYTGNLHAEQLKEEISLGVFQPGAKGTLDFTVSVPSELKNEYALRDTAVKWYFTVYEEDSKTAVTPIPSGSLQRPADSENDRNENQLISAVKTADETPILMFLCAAILSIITGTTVLIVQKRG